MARTTGTFDFSANFEVNKTAPLDARLTVEDKSELTGLPFAYIGMVVAVTSDSTATNNGVYVLDDTDGTTLSNWKLVGANSGSFSGSFEGDGSGLTGVAPAAGDGIFVNGTTVSVDSASLATDMAGTYLTAANGTLNLAANIGTIDETTFTGSFSGSYTGDGSGLTGVVAAVDIDALTAGTTLHQTQDSFIFSDNGTEKKITFSNLEDAIFSNISGDATVAAGGALTIANSLGDIDSTSFTGSFSGSFDGQVNILDTNNTGSFQLVFREGTAGGFSSLYADQDNAKLRYNPGTNTLENTTLIGDVTGDLTGTATSASHAADAYDTVSVSNATISLTDMGGNTDQITVNNVANADTASAVIVTADNSTDLNFYITTAKNVGGQSVYAHSALAFNPSTGIVSANTGELHFEANSFTGSFKGDVDGAATQASKVETQSTNSTNTHYITFVDSNNGSAAGELVYTVEGIAVDPGNAGITANSFTGSFKGDLDGNAATATSATNAESASHVAAAFDTISVTNATITLTDMGGNTSSGTVNNVSNATTAVNATNATNATNINVDQASDDTNYHITFTETTTGNAGLLVDNNGKLTYNPSTDVLSVGATLSVGGSATVGTNLTVGGDLTVNGTTTTLNTTNLEVEDAYILLRSGTSTIGSSGIIFGGSEGTLNSGSALVWDAAYNSNDGRLAVTSGSYSSITGNPDTSYYLAGVFQGTEAAAATAQADHPGNIRIESNEIYIYV